MIAPTPYFSDRGCHIRIAEELQALYAAGHSAVVYTYHLGRDVGPAPIQRTRRLPWYRKTSAGPSWHKFYLDLILLVKILRTTRRGEFDIIHAHVHEGAAVGIIAGWWLKLPVVADVQSQLTEELKLYGWSVPGLRQLAHWVEGWIVRHADWVYVSSPHALELLQQLYRTSADKMELLLDGVGRVPALKPEPKLGPANTVPVIVYAGGTGKGKGVETLLTALEELVQRGLAFTVLFIGKLPVDWQQRLDSGLVRGRCKIITHIPYEKLLAVLQLADIGVDPKPPTSTESSGKILNYMAAGLATVAFTSTTTARLLATAGVLVPQPTAASLATALAALVRDQALRSSLGSAAHHRVQAEFVWEKLFTPVLRSYATLLQAHRS